MGTRPFPNHFIEEAVRPENRVKDEFEVMTSGRIAMKVQATLRFQGAMNLD